MIEILPLSKPIRAVISAPPSKAHTLRAFFLGALASGQSTFHNPLLAADQIYAYKVLEQLGASFLIKKDKVIVKGVDGRLKTPPKPLFVGESGVVARFLLSLAALVPKGKVVIDGGPRMRKGRPLTDLIKALNQLGVKINCLKKYGYLPLEVYGNTFRGGFCCLKGNISSQYFSSILIAAPYAPNDITIECSGELSSKPYVDITLKMMADFGVRAENYHYRKFFVKAGQHYKASCYKIEGDYTNASYLLAAVAISGGRISIKNLPKDSKQGDKIFLDILQRMGCRVLRREGEVIVSSSGQLKSIKRIDMNAYPDLVPTLAVTVIFTEGETEIYNVGHLRYKECDRLKALATELKKIGAQVKEKKEGLIIKGGKQSLHGAEINCYRDHRIAMAFSIVGLKIPGIIITDEECVEKSFIDFYRVLKQIGGRIKIKD